MRDLCSARHGSGCKRLDADGGFGDDNNLKLVLPVP